MNKIFNLSAIDVAVVGFLLIMHLTAVERIIERVVSAGPMGKTVVITIEKELPPKIIEVPELPVAAVIAKSKYDLSDDLIKTVAKHISAYSKVYEPVPPSLVYAIFDRESDFDPYCVSPADCYGLGQINYYVWKKELQIPEPKYLYDIENNIKCTYYVLRKYYQEEQDWNITLQRYFGICAKAEGYAQEVLALEKIYKQ